MKRQYCSGKITLVAMLALAALGWVDIGTTPAAVVLPKSTATPAVKPIPVLDQNILMPRSPTAGNPSIATVNGVALSKAHFLNSLLRMSGVGLLEKWIQLTVLKQACQKAGLHVGKAQIDAAEQGVLNQLAAQHVPVNQRIPVLEKLLARKGQSLADFRMALARTTYMLALAKGHVQVTNADVEQAYKVNFGPKAEVRDIVVATFDAAATVRHLIVDKHENPALVAQQHSINTQNAANGGLEIIPLEDKALPRILVNTAAELEPNELSAAVPVNGDLHLLWLVKKIPALKVPLPKVKVGLKADLLNEMEMRWGQIELNRLVAQSKITIDNPILKQEFTALREAYAEQARLLRNEQKAQQKNATSAPVPASAPKPQAGTGK
ncbi:MAG: hypothetical protein ACP5VQ_06360 [Phycisphaerae bacterium]